MKLVLKGARCSTPKCSFERRSFAPGEHGIRRRKVSDYGRQLREKQKAKRIYSVLERQFKNYFANAVQHKGITGEKLLQMLECRLDNVVYKLGLAKSRAEARQLIIHGHFAVNDRKVNVPSFQVTPGDEVKVRNRDKSPALFQEVLDVSSARVVPEWLSADAKNLSGKVLSLPERDQLELSIAEQLIVEYYSR